MEAAAAAIAGVRRWAALALVLAPIRCGDTVRHSPANRSRAWRRSSTGRTMCLGPAGASWPLHSTCPKPLSRYRFQRMSAQTSLGAPGLIWFLFLFFPPPLPLLGGENSVWKSTEGVGLFISPVSNCNRLTGLADLRRDPQLRGPCFRLGPFLAQFCPAVVQVPLTCAQGPTLP